MNPIGRIINGTAFSGPEHFMFAIVTPFENPDLNTTEWFLTCGASRLNERWLITAAHCVYSSHVVWLISHEHDLKSSPDSCTTLVRGSRRCHPDWDGTITGPDVCMIRLDTLPPAQCSIDTLGLLADPTYVPTAGVVSGWGFGSNGSLMTAHVPIHTQAFCTSTWGIYFDANRHLCAGNATQDACFGDSGGPLYVEQQNSKVMVGIVSFGEAENCAATYPTVYTRVSAFHDWATDYLVEKADDCACVASSAERSDGVVVHEYGCRRHNGAPDTWCYTRGGIRCLTSVASTTYRYAAWTNCAGPPGAPPPPQSPAPSPPSPLPPYTTPPPTPDVVIIEEWSFAFLFQIAFVLCLVIFCLWCFCQRRDERQPVVPTPRLVPSPTAPPPRLPSDFARQVTFRMS